MCLSYRFYWHVQVCYTSICNITSWIIQVSLYHIGKSRLSLYWIWSNVTCYHKMSVKSPVCIQRYSLLNMSQNDRKQSKINTKYWFLLNKTRSFTHISYIILELALWRIESGIILKSSYCYFMLILWWWVTYDMCWHTGKYVCVRPGIQSEDQNQFFTFKVRTFWQSEVKISVLALWLCALSSLCHNMGVGGVWT